MAQVAASALTVRDHPPRGFGGPLLVGLAALLLAVVPQMVQPWRGRMALAAASQAQDATWPKATACASSSDPCSAARLPWPSPATPGKAALDALARQGITYTPPPKP